MRIQQERRYTGRRKVKKSEKYKREERKRERRDRFTKSSIHTINHENDDKKGRKRK